MYIRKNKNRSGTVIIQVISKESGKYRVVKTLGSADNPEDIALLEKAARNFVTEQEHNGQISLFVEKEEIAIQEFVRHIENKNIRIVGPDLILGAIFSAIGFDAVPGDLFRHLVITRLVNPGSKLRTVDYLDRCCGFKISVDKVYRFLDELAGTRKEQVGAIAFAHTKRVLHGNVGILFYDMTTLYFESENEDDLRKIGYSKDGKFQNPQIMLGLLVGEHGYPVGYDIFRGNTFEGTTIIPVVERFCSKYGIKKPIVVGDAGLLSKDTIEKLEQQGYAYILGARIKNESETIKQDILQQVPELQLGKIVRLPKTQTNWLILSYTEARAKKDAVNRDRGICKLRAKIASGSLTKKHIVNRGYNKFLTIKNTIEVDIDEAKITEDKRWDGLKGYVTNSSLAPETIIGHYTQLWEIEKAFRISKTDLRIRPIFHRLERRIEAHICIAFAAYTIYKELERLLNTNEMDMSAQKAIELTQTMYGLDYQLPNSAGKECVPFKMDANQTKLYTLIRNIT